MTEQQARELFRTASESIEVIGSPYHDVVAQARDRRRREGRVVVVAVVAAVCAVGLGSWVAARTADGSADPKPPGVVDERNPVDVAWYAAGVLHLHDVTVELAQMRDLIDVDDGAVYSDDEGTIRFVSATGRRSVLGTKTPGAPTAVTGALNWVAWVEPGARIGRLVVWSIPAHKLIDDLPVDPTTRVLAIDQARVYYEARGVESSWAPGQTPQQLPRTGLLDIESTTRVYADQDTNGALGRIGIEQSFFGVSFRRVGEGAMLSPGGDVVLTHDPGASYDGRAFSPLLYDTRTGERLPTGLHPGEVAIDAAFGPTRTLNYLVVREDDLAGAAQPLVVLRSCELASSTCHDVLPLAKPGETPLLAH